MPKKKPEPETRGPKPELLKVDGKWQDAVKKYFEKKEKVVPADGLSQGQQTILTIRFSARGRTLPPGTPPRPVHRPAMSNCWALVITAYSHYSVLGVLRGLFNRFWRIPLHFPIYSQSEGNQHEKNQHCGDQKRYRTGGLLHGAYPYTLDSEPTKSALADFID